MLGTKILKDNFDEEYYKSVADWCNANDCTIKDTGEAYVVVKVDTTEDELRYKKLNLKNEISSINVKLSELRGISECAISVDGQNEYDVFKDGILVTMNETEFQNYFDELTEKRSDLLQQYKELMNGNENN